MAVRIFFNWLEDAAIPSYGRLPSYGVVREGGGWSVYPSTADFLSVSPTDWSPSNAWVPLFEFRLCRRKFLRWMRNRMSEVRTDGVFHLIFRGFAKASGWGFLGLMFIPGPGESHFTGEVAEAASLAWRAVFPPEGTDASRIHPAISAMMAARIARRAESHTRSLEAEALRRRAELLVVDGMTEERLASIDSAMRAACEKEALRKARKECLRRSEELLLRHLSEAQRTSYLSVRSFDVLGSDGRTYRVFDVGAHNVRCGDFLYCIVPRSPIPMADQMLAQKLLLETDASTFLKIANRDFITDEQTERFLNHCRRVDALRAAIEAA